MWFAARNVMRCRTILNEVFTLRPKGASHLKFLYFVQCNEQNQEPQTIKNQRNLSFFFDISLGSDGKNRGFIEKE